MVAFVDITERKLAEAALASVSGKLIEAQEQERRRIARELHDDIGQRLSLLAIELAQLQQRLPNPSELPGRLAGLRSRTSEVATDVQSLSHQLHSSKLQYLGIAAAMRGFCQEFGDRQKAEVDFEVTDCRPLYRQTSLFASSECCKKLCITQQSTAEYGTLRCDCGEHPMRFISRSAIWA